jgi:hypothetical protein
MIKSYRDLIVWQKAMSLTVEVYRLSRQLPSGERFGWFLSSNELRSQFRRTLPRVTSGEAVVIFADLYRSLGVLSPRLRRTSSSFSGWNTLQGM